jgi:hypothetical protein
MNILTSLTWILLTLSAFALIYGVRYLKNKENMALIEKNQDITRSGNKSILLMIGISLISISLGFVLGLILTNSVLEAQNAAVVYMVSIVFTGGIGTIVSYYLNQKL